MSSKVHPMTKFGLDVHMFCAYNMLSKKQLAELADIPYDTLMQISNGRRSGRKTIPKVYDAMRQLEASKGKRRWV